MSVELNDSLYQRVWETIFCHPFFYEIHFCGVIFDGGIFALQIRRKLCTDEGDNNSANQQDYAGTNNF